MVGFDKNLIEQDLLKAGWRTLPNHPFRDLLIPPDNLWDKRKLHYNIYEARDLHELLTGDEIGEK